MTYAPVVCYYSSASPQSGYSAAVRGYAQKLAAALGFEAIQLNRYIKSFTQPPEITVGVELSGEVVASRLALKARPYGDMHGLGPSMHALTANELCSARREPRAGKTGLVLVANPHWLVTDGAHWAQRLQQWARCNALARLIISNSPRSNPLMWAQFSNDIAQALTLAYQLNDAQGADNQYLSALAEADAICILGSSRSMAGEAAMTGASIAYVADDTASEAGFFRDLPAVLAPRFHHFSADSPLEAAAHKPYDVTQVYVDAAVEQFFGAKAVA